MRFVEKWSFGCAKRLAEATQQNHNKRSIYYYGFYIIFTSVIKLSIILALALTLDILIPSLIILFIFASLRTFAGGYHMDSLFKCLFTSILLYILLAYVAQHTYTEWNIYSILAIIVFTLIIGLYTLYKYAPKDNPNKPITDPVQIKTYKKNSIIYHTVLIALSIILAYFGLYMYVLSICFGILLEILSITPIGYRFFDIVKNGLSINKA